MILSVATPDSSLQLTQECVLVNVTGVLGKLWRHYVQQVLHEITLPHQKVFPYGVAVL